MYLGNDRGRSEPLSFVVEGSRWTRRCSAAVKSTYSQLFLRWARVGRGLNSAPRGRWSHPHPRDALQTAKHPTRTAIFRSELGRPHYATPHSCKPSPPSQHLHTHDCFGLSGFPSTSRYWPFLWRASLDSDGSMYSGRLVSGSIY